MRTAKTDQAGRMPRLIWVSLGAYAILFILSHAGSYVLFGAALELMASKTGLINVKKIVPQKLSYWSFQGG